MPSIVQRKGVQNVFSVTFIYYKEIEIIFFNLYLEKSIGNKIFINIFLFGYQIRNKIWFLMYPINGGFLFYHNIQLIF